MRDREKFECWLCNDYFDGMDGPGDFVESRGIYKDYQVHLAWLAFNAGRDSMREDAANAADDQWVKDPRVSASDAIKAIV